jgi:formylmethanofuran dehydrogenase subunit C
MISLRPLRDLKFPIAAKCINPDVFQEKTLRQIELLQVWEGNKQKRLGDIFRIDEIITREQSDSQVIEVCGNVSKVQRIGSGMESGEIVIRGNAGMYVGEEMRGGKIIVRGNAGGWTGSMMKGGSIEIHGNTGDYLGAPYRGSVEAMRGGKITVGGSVGNEVGAYMRRGVIEIHGNAGQFAGFRMLDGTIHIQGDCEARAGACMTEGKIVVEGQVESVLPTFTIEGIRPNVKIEENEAAEGPMYAFVGDIAENGTGRLYVSTKMNPHLNRYEKFLGTELDE